MGVSRGSFYWHFADLSAFHAAVLKHGARLRPRRSSPGSRLPLRTKSARLLLRRVFGERLTLENAGPHLASVDPTARAAVQAIDRAG